MAVNVAVDFGTSSTCVAVSVDGREPQVANVDGQPLISSAVFAAADGTLFVGQEAERQAAIDPARYEPHPKRRIDEGELLLGDAVLAVQDVVRAVLRRAVGEARRIAGNRGVDLLVLTHPADWGVIRTRTLRQAGAGLGHRVVLVPEPVAAAVFHAANHTMPDGKALAVLDLGGGTVDVSVVRKSRGAPGSVGGFEVLATKGDPNFGGSDIDQLLLEHVGSLLDSRYAEDWQRLMTGRELADRRRRRVLRADVRSSKETLSRHPYTDVPLPDPFNDAHVTRADLERLIGEPLRRTVELAAAALTDSQVPREQLGGVFLVGGSSRIPHVARLVHERLGVIPVTLDQPETVVARGALRAVLVDPEHTDGYSTGPARGPQSAPQSQPVPPPYAAGPRPVVPQPVPAPQPAPPRAASPPPPFQQVPAEAPAKRKRALWIAGAVVVLAAAVVLGLVFGFGGSTPEPPKADNGTPLAAYDYAFTLPAGWQQSGGNPPRRGITVSPGGDASPEARVYVEETRLRKPVNNAQARQGFLADLEPKVRAAGFTGFRPSIKYADRDVAYYRGQSAEGSVRANVDWYVLVDGEVQLSIGCQYSEAQAQNMRPSCERIVRSMRIRNQG
ncbi:type VII secretion-associated protein [Sciscionella marina]|uniref:type VII secretion-associated protein n=1 Tax=Sciscionella marina TaxID=508770 RepID=UPI00037F207A|nr:type VII secretion-associated protein [Sciscionella marina]